MKPQEIEELSFRIIESEAGNHGFPPEEWRIVRRMIHTSADFEYLDTVRFHPEAVSRGMEAIRSGKPIFTDTEMARSGIRKKETRHFGVSVECRISDPHIAEIAGKNKGTRAEAAVDAALPLMKGGIYVIGNAPTALLRLIRRIGEGAAAPALVVGFPVGFVNAAESKAELAACHYPYITNIGRKGGSNIAASVVNALLIMAAGEDAPGKTE